MKVIFDTSECGPHAGRGEEERERDTDRTVVYL
jgi:hypothetical protein